MIFWEKIRVKTKQKQTARRRICLRAKKLFKYQALLVLYLLMLVIFSCKCSANDGCNDHVVINEIYGGGGNSGAIYKNDFIELYNNSNVDINLTGWSVQYASSSSENFSVVFS